MARENQSLQIALIVFVTLTAMLGVATYVVYRSYDQARTTAEQAQKKASQSDQTVKQKDDDINTLKDLIGLAKTDNAKAVFDEDMKKYAANQPEEGRKYRPLLTRLAKAVEERNAELADAKSKNAELMEKYALREASKDSQLKDFNALNEKLQKEVDNKVAELKAARDRYLADSTALKTNWDNSNKDMTAKLDKADANFAATNAKLEGVVKNYNTKAEKLNKMTAETFDATYGKIVKVVQGIHRVWIDLGRADGLQEKVTFSIYPLGLTNLATVNKKASIEVTKILGDHLAEARITDDQPTNPIMLGDLIHSPIWSPGEKKHVAVTGFIEIANSGKNELRTLLNLITMNGGVVDSYLDEKGKVVGEMTASTRYLICGDQPNEKGEPAMIDGNTQMIKTADEFGIRQMPVPELIDRLGWKNLSPVTHYGRKTNPAEFRPRFKDDVQPKAGGATKPRESGEKLHDITY